MTTTTHAESLIHLRLQEHLQELRHLLADVRSRGWTLELAQVLEAIRQVEDGRPLPPQADSFHALAVARQRCLRDVCRLRAVARPASRRAATGLAGWFSSLLPRQVAA